MLKKIKNFIDPDEYIIKVFKDKINIVNYIRIISISQTNISILLKDSKVTITGTNLFLSKLLDQEILIIGKINKFEVVERNE